MHWLCLFFPPIYRYDSHSGGEREIQRTMLELLNQLDGFDSGGDVKVGLSRVGSCVWVVYVYMHMLLIGTHGTPD